VNAWDGNGPTIVQRHWTLPFDYRKAPLTQNQRWPHWAVKGEATRNVRLAAKLLAMRVPALARCRVELIWYVTTNHRRDPINITPTMKAMCDGLVDAGVVPDDTPAFMDTVMPRIVKSDRARMELLITALDTPDADAARESAHFTRTSGWNPQGDTE
jgi:hypothetical protein